MNVDSNQYCNEKNKNIVVYVTAKFELSFLKSSLLYRIKNLSNANNPLVPVCLIDSFNLFAPFPGYSSLKIIINILSGLKENKYTNITFKTVSGEEIVEVSKKDVGDGNIYCGAVNLRNELLDILIEKKILKNKSWKYYFHAVKKSRIIEEVVALKNVQNAIYTMAQENNRDESHYKALAEYYGKQVFSNRWYNMNRLFAAIGKVLCKRFYAEIKEIDSHKLGNISKTHQVVFVPSHKSHFDSFIFANNYCNRLGHPPPFVVTSQHMNFFPTNVLFRGSSGFLIYRQAKDIVYNAVLNEYIKRIAYYSNNILMYIEGTRSRNGMVSSPKAGIASQVINSYICQTESVKPVAFVPISINYDKLVESETILSDMIEYRKMKNIATEDELIEWEKISNKTSTTSYFIKSFISWLVKGPVEGKAYLKYCDPIYLNETLQEFDPGWEKLEKDNGTGMQPAWQMEVAKKIGLKIVTKYNLNTIVTSSSLLSTTVIAHKGQNFTQEECKSFMNIIITLIKSFPSDDIYFSDDVKNNLEEAHHFNIFNTKEEEAEIIVSKPLDMARAERYKNSIVHLFIIPLLIVKLIEEGAQSKHELSCEIKKDHEKILSEYFLIWNDIALLEIVENYIGLLVEMRLVKYKNNRLYLDSDNMVTIEKLHNLYQ